MSLSSAELAAYSRAWAEIPLRHVRAHQPAPDLDVRGIDRRRLTQQGDGLGLLASLLEVG